MFKVNNKGTRACVVLVVLLLHLVFVVTYFTPFSIVDFQQVNVSCWILDTKHENLFSFSFLAFIDFFQSPFSVLTNNFSSIRPYLNQ